MCVCACMSVCMCVCICHNTHVKVGGQLCVICSLHPPLCVSKVWTQVTRLGQQASLPTEPLQSQLFFFFLKEINSKFWLYCWREKTNHKQTAGAIWTPGSIGLNCGSQGGQEAPVCLPEEQPPSGQVLFHSVAQECHYHLDLLDVELLRWDQWLCGSSSSSR